MKILRWSSLFIINIAHLLSNYISSLSPQEIKIGTKNQLISSTKDCEQFKISTNYKHILIQIDQISNIGKIQITDKLVDNCNVNECDLTSNICQIRSVEKNSEINFDSKMCVGSIFIVLQKSDNPNPDTQEEFHLQMRLSVDYILNEANENCAYIHQSPYAYCGESSLDDCRNCHRPSCTVIQCGYESGVNNEEKFNKLYELCVPYSVTDKEKKERCLIFQGATTYRPTGECEYDDLEGYSSLTVILIGIGVIAVLVFSLTVIYYNVYLMKYSDPPFVVPSVFPEFLFPTKSSGRKTIDNLDIVFSGK